MRTTYLFSILCLVIAAACNQKEREGKWYKGNLHTHTFWSDGDEYPEMVLKWYQEHGYNFVALSDHNTISNTEKWIVVPKSALYEKSFADYVNRFGADWVEYKTDTGRTQVKLKTYDEYRNKIFNENFLVIHSEEISDQIKGVPIHVNVSNVQELVVPPGGNSPTEVMQNIVDLVLEQRERTGVAMIPHVNHPNFHWAITAQDFIPLRGERFFEVFNGHPFVHNYGDSIHMGTEQMWDVINVAYANRGQSLLYGLATDDTHNYHEFGAAFSNAGRGWIMVRADSLTESNLIQAMEQGDFYATTGVTLSTLKCNHNELIVKAAAEGGVQYKIEFVGADKTGVIKVFESVDDSEARFKLTDDMLFVRARVTSSRRKENPFKEGDFEMAWTQPVQFVSN